MPSATDYFVSKRDRWLVGVIWTSVLVGIAALTPALFAVCSQPLTLAVIVAGILALGFGPWVLYATGYAFERDILSVRGGPFRWRVPFAEIQLVKPSNNPLSSPACSLDRLLIEYGNRKIMVSPLDRLGFLSRLAAACPHLQRSGERLAPPLSSSGRGRTHSL